MHVAFIGLGSNLGDRQAMIAAAIEQIGSGSATRVMAVSSLHETVAVGGLAGQPDFLNGAAKLETGLEPLDLLRFLLEIERGLGRVRCEHWGPRTIDLDLLLYDDCVLDAPELTLPHPHMHERRFVLAPLAEIAADLRHPVLGRTIDDLLRDVSE